ncbi:MAG: hypothetical protein ACJAYE_002977 [Candidatus Azotimanducaceae bacterium]|jgi:hypothetical protein
MSESAPLQITYQHVPRFSPGAPEGIAYLEEHGYVVIANALSEEEASTAIDKLWR